MICIDTTVLIDEFRARGRLDAPVNRALLEHRHEQLIVPAAAAGEFMDGAASVSEQRIQEALALLSTRRVVECGLTTAGHYGRIVSHLRANGKLAGHSHNDIWIAASAREHGARLLTRNPGHFEDMPGLEVIAY